MKATGRSLASGIGIGAIALAIGATGSAAAAGAPSLVRVNVSSGGAQANDGLIDKPVLSADGRFVAFASGATNLVAGDTNDYFDIFVRDRKLGTTSRVSVSSSGAQSNGASFAPTISADGRYVAYDSYGTNLASGDTNGGSDVFVYDLLARTTVKVSKSASGGAANGESAFASISADGRYVAFDSTATNIVPGDTNAHGDVFRWDRTTGKSVRVSLRNNGTQSSDGAGGLASISADGSKIAFVSSSTDLMSGDTNGYNDVYVRNQTAGTTTRASLGSDGRQGQDDVDEATISADGTHVAFNLAWPLVDADEGWTEDVYVRNLTAGTTAWASGPVTGAPANDSRGESYGAALSGDGRYVAFTSFANDLLDGDLNTWQEVYLRDMTSGTVSRIAANSAGIFGTASSYGPSVTPDGAHVAFGASADNLVNLDTNNSDDVFVYEPGGNAFPAPVDVTAPNTTVTSGPKSSITTRSATFTFTSTEAGSTFQCKLDATAWASCTSPKSVSALAKGKHTMNVRAKDAAGNVDASPATWAFTVR